MFRKGAETVLGLGSRKQAISRNGGNTLALAIAMLESKDMGANYVYGDDKANDAANFGIFKQNWHMIRSSFDQFSGLGPKDFRHGSVLNDDLKLDIEVLLRSQRHYAQKWFAGHRNGESGLLAPDTADIRSYQSGIEWIREQIESDDKYLTDDTRFWVNIPRI